MSQRNPLTNPKLDPEFFLTLPQEIIISILARLPVRTIISCKCVCKSWLNLIKTHEFAKSHLSVSVPGLAICHAESQSDMYRIFEIEDGLDLEHHELHHNPIIKFNLPYHGWICGSANGLLFLRDHILKPDDLYICNPITRDCIKLHFPQEFVHSDVQMVTYGFGVSKITAQLKVVRIFQDYIGDLETIEQPSKSECQVYTLGTGSWRRISPGAPLRYGDDYTTGAFLNGNLHWLVCDSNDSPWISCFDLETELFSTFSTPIPSHGGIFLDVFALGDCLCLCENTLDNKIVIWLMKEYGVVKSWTKELVICKTAFTGESYGIPYPIKVFKDGDILIAWQCEEFSLFYYSKKDSTAQKIDMFEPHNFIDTFLHTPSFLSLKSFRRENVSSV